MPHQGWIKLHRKMMYSNVFQNEKLLKVFVYCLMKATHSDRKQLVGKQFVDLEKGQFVFGRKKAAIELNMKESTVRDYIELLKQDEMIQVFTTNKYSVITVVNWEIYQHEEDEPRQQNDNKMTAEGQQNDTNKNVKNVKNDKNKDSRKRVYDETSLYYKMTDYFYKLILKNNPQHKKPNYQTWSDDFRKMVELDKRDKDQVRIVMEFVQSDDFEMKNVLSPSKLRQRYDQLFMKANQSKSNNFVKPKYEVVEGGKSNAEHTGESGHVQLFR